MDITSPAVNAINTLATAGEVPRPRLAVKVEGDLQRMLSESHMMIQTQMEQVKTLSRQMNDQAAEMAAQRSSMREQTARMELQSAAMKEQNAEMATQAGVMKEQNAEMSTLRNKLLAMEHKISQLLTKKGIQVAGVTGAGSGTVVCGIGGYVLSSAACIGFVLPGVALLLVGSILIGGSSYMVYKCM